MQTISKSQFKPKALQYFREIQKTGHEIIISDHGKPVLKISPFRENTQTVLAELRNSVLRYDDPLESVAEGDWDVLK
jgi:antitoxin (DNA-binding transcriptional repressor) of toxin-antitoxin stability system